MMHKTALTVPCSMSAGTVDFDIYDHCLLRIGLFRQSLGGSEEILGRITRELRSVAESLELTAAERQERLQQLTDNEIRLLQEQERLEEYQAELFGIVLPPQQIEQEIRDASSAWLTPQALQNLIQSYLVATCGGDDHILGERPLKTLRLSQEARNRLLEDFRKLPRQASPLYREWEKWLKGGDYRLDITFDATCAAEHRHATFITPIHPLAQQAALSGDPWIRELVRRATRSRVPSRNRVEKSGKAKGLNEAGARRGNYHSSLQTGNGLELSSIILSPRL